MHEKAAALLQKVQLPPMFRVRQVFDRTHIAPEDITDYIAGMLSDAPHTRKIRPGMRIAITVGSRGVANIPIITKAIADFVKSRGAHPFVVPAMGSHGGATAEGQRAVLAGYGVTEETIGCPILSSMEVKKIGVNADGMDVFIDKNAAEADGIIVNCRIKPHTSFRGPFESGIMKMMTIGLGKQVGAETCHRAGFKYMAKYVPMFGQAIIENAPILFAVATIENAYDQTAELVTVDAPDVYEQEPILLQRAFANMPRILVDSCELLIVDECGKYFSGNGMDPNVSGKFPTPYASGGIESQHIVALDIDEASHGNAQGLGLASATTVRAVKKLDLDAMYVNGITCKMLYGCEIPPFMNNDREAIQMGLAMCVDYDEAHPRIVRIPNTLHLEHIMLSEAYYDEARRNPDLIIESEPAPLAFDADGNLAFDLDNAP